MDLARSLSLFSREQLNSMEKLKDEVKSPDDLKSYDDWRKNQLKEKLLMFVQDPIKYRKEQPTTYK
jgi:predicted restriction endonuclease